MVEVRQDLEGHLDDQLKAQLEDQLVGQLKGQLEVLLKGQLEGQPPGQQKDQVEGHRSQWLPLAENHQWWHQLAARHSCRRPLEDRR